MSLVKWCYMTLMLVNRLNVKLTLIGFFIEFFRKKWDFNDFYGSVVGGTNDFFSHFFSFFLFYRLKGIIELS